MADRLARALIPPEFNLMVILTPWQSLTGKATVDMIDANVGAFARLAASRALT